MRKSNPETDMINPDIKNDISALCEDARDGSETAKTEIAELFAIRHGGENVSDDSLFSLRERDEDEDDSLTGLPVSPEWKIEDEENPYW